MALVRIPTPLRRLTNEKDEVSISSDSVAQMIIDLETEFPGIKDRLCDEQGEIRKFINIYINNFALQNS